MQCTCLRDKLQWSPSLTAPTTIPASQHPAKHFMPVICPVMYLQLPLWKLSLLNWTLYLKQQPFSHQQQQTQQFLLQLFRSPKCQSSRQSSSYDYAALHRTCRISTKSHMVVKMLTSSATFLEELLVLQTVRVQPTMLIT